MTERSSNENLKAYHYTRPENVYTILGGEDESKNGLLPHAGYSGSLGLSSDAVYCLFTPEPIEWMANPLEWNYLMMKTGQLVLEIDLGEALKQKMFWRQVFVGDWGHNITDESVSMLDDARLYNETFVALIEYLISSDALKFNLPDLEFMRKFRENLCECMQSSLSWKRKYLIFIIPANHLMS